MRLYVVTEEYSEELNNVCVHLITSNLEEAREKMEELISEWISYAKAQRHEFEVEYTGLFLATVSFDEGNSWTSIRIHPTDNVDIKYSKHQLATMLLKASEKAD